jgi:hypothetical protein
MRPPRAGALPARITSDREQEGHPPHNLRIRDDDGDALFRAGPLNPPAHLVRGQESHANHTAGGPSQLST